MARRSHALVLRHYTVLAVVSNCCPLPSGRSPYITHPSATRQQEQALLLPFDLHVLSLPPAFNLSHDQTLQFKVWCSMNVDINFISNDSCVTHQDLIFKSVDYIFSSCKCPHRLSVQVFKELTADSKSSQLSLSKGCVYYATLWG